MSSGLVEAWRMSCAAGDHLLDAIPEASLADRYAPRVRDVGGQFAHVHGTRVRWLEHAAPALARDLATFPRGAHPTRAELRRALKASAAAVERFLERCGEEGRVRGWNGPPESFLAYLAAHEAHHRGLAMVALRLSGHAPTSEVVYGQWKWGKRGG